MKVLLVLMVKDQVATLDELVQAGNDVTYSAVKFDDDTWARYVSDPTSREIYWTELRRAIETELGLREVAV